MTARIPSFTDFLTSYAPDLLPGSAELGPDPSEAIKGLRHATTIVAAECEGGVVLAGDRRATMGNVIAQRDVEKIHRSDEFSAMGFAGTGSLGLEFARLFQVELEHYEKMEGRTLSLEGKANRLANMVRGNIGGAMQGLVVIPLFAGYDEDAGTGRIFSYDVVGGPYEEHRYASIGSGSVYAKSSLKKLFRDGMSSEDVVLAVVQALYDAADDDSATGGPDLTRQIFPVVSTITADGFHRLPDSETAEIAQQVVSGRLGAPDGPSAPLS
ncbi:MAG: proteasome subunit beta [Streptosporangiales bacterium]|nr:proteasome subunit beta [Streptosporangiales bacterium]